MLTPSVAVATLESLFPFISQPAAGGNVAGNLAGKVAAAIAVVEAIPTDLFVLDGADTAAFLTSMAELRSAVLTWQQRGETVGQVSFVFFRRLHEVLTKCPDRRGAVGPSVFAFFKDPDLQADLDADLSEVNIAISQGEWKSATVIAGSMLEAMLLWEHQQDSTRTKAASAAAVAKATMTQPDSDPNKWTLHQCIEIAAEAGVLNGPAATLARLAKDYRNLIHPGRATRLAQKPDRSTALAAVAAVEATIKALRLLHP